MALGSYRRVRISGTSAPRVVQLNACRLCIYTSGCHSKRVDEGSVWYRQLSVGTLAPWAGNRWLDRSEVCSLMAIYLTGDRATSPQNIGEIEELIESLIYHLLERR